MTPSKLKAQLTFLWPWLALFIVLLILAAACQQYAPAVGKAYALIGTVLAAVHFFRESTWKRYRDALAAARPASSKAEDMLERSRQALDAAVNTWNPSAVRFMQLALVFAAAAFLIDLIDTIRSLRK